MAGQQVLETYEVLTGFKMVMMPKSRLKEESGDHNLSDPQDRKPAAIGNVSTVYLSKWKHDGSLKTTKQFSPSLKKSQQVGSTGQTMKKLKSVIKPALSVKSTTKVSKKLKYVPQILKSKSSKRKLRRKTHPVPTETNPSTIWHKSDKTLLESTSSDDDDLGMPRLTGDRKLITLHKTLQKTKLVIKKHSSE
jgi:hypothetical protein